MDIREDSVSANMASHALCRACMCNATDLQSVFIESKVMERKISEMITYVTGIQIEESDGLPKQICNQCVSLTESASFFKEQCYQSDTTFRRIIKSTQDERNLIKREQDCSIELEVNETSGSAHNRMKEDSLKHDVESLGSAIDKISAEKSSTDALYQCAVCSLRFQLCSRLKEHIKNEHEDHFKSKNADKVAKAKFSCQICSKVFRSMTTYSAHYRRCEKKSISKKPKEKKIKEEIVSSDSDTPLAENLRYEDHNSDVEYNPMDAVTEDHFDDSLTLEKSDIKLELESIPIECDEVKAETVIDKNVKKNKVYSCVECDMTFNWKMFSLHMKSEHSNDISEKPAKVKREYKKLHKTNGVIEKKKAKKKKQDVVETIDACEIIWNGDDVSGDDAKDANIPVPYSCTMCERKFSKFTTLTLHLKKHEDQLSEVHTCLTCKREFKRKAHLDNHILTHSVEKGFKCTLCDKAFARQDSLSMHIANHEGIKKHQCNFCEKGFNMLSTLKDHIRTHTGEKPFLCSICGRGFSQSTNLKEHVRRHQGYKPFKCSFCDQTFVSKGELEAHTRKHSGAHPFVCDVCGGGFTTSSSLVKHKRIHTGERPYQCDFCPMRFTALGTLKNHRRTHTGEKPYKCIYCDKAFAQKNDLVSHTRTHTGERPYVCSACGHAFRQSSALKTHFKIHGGMGDQEMGCIKVPDPMLAITGLVVTKGSDDSTSVSLMTPKSETSQQ